MKHYAVHELRSLYFEARGLAAAIAYYKQSRDEDWETAFIDLVCEETGEEVSLAKRS